jgi:hypothetical protein
VTYAAFCDPSGGVNDAMTLAVAHLRDGAICVLDAALEVRPPFDPEVAVSACTAVLRRFGVTRVIGDRYAGLWPAARFAEHGIAFEQSARPKSDLYCDLLPLLNAKRVELLDSPRLASQLVGLERRTARSGRDTVDHTPGGHDDLANVVAGVLVGLDLDRRPALVRQSDMLVHSAALPLPTICKYIVAVLAVDKNGAAAVVYAAGMWTGPALLLLDFESGPLRGGLFSNIAARVRELAVLCRARGGVVFVPAVLSKHAAAAGLLAEAIPEDIQPEELLLSAANHAAAGNVKICAPAMDKAQTTPFRSALDFRAAEGADDPLRAAALLTIALALDHSA